MAAVDAPFLEEMARTALATGEEEAALAQLAPAAERSGDARLWQFTALLERSLDKHSAALRSFSAASKLAPADASIARGHARVALEAGVDAVDLFERARRLAPNEGAVLLGLISAKFASGRGDEAEAELDAAVEQSPLWIDGHVQLAQLRSMLGRRAPLGASIERALASMPTDERLWTALLNLALSSEQFQALEGIALRARAAAMNESLIAPFEAIAASEQGGIGRADRLLEAMDPKLRATIPLWHVRHLLRAQRLDQAMSLIDDGLERDGAENFWPYAAIAWRLAADPRWEWLAQPQLIQQIDLSERIAGFERLGDVLRSLHVAKGEYIDQSVRGGTQTDGPLLSRIEPEIQSLRAAIVDAVQGYLTQLPAIDPAHPLLGQRRDRRIRFSGSWSVRLRGAGFHVNHVHPQGWISSALYVALPDRGEARSADAGWLKLGEAPAGLAPDPSPAQLIEPQVGRLVLFPSWMWHGTVPFEQGDRLTVAFDVRPPI